MLNTSAFHYLTEDDLACGRLDFIEKTVIIKTYIAMDRNKTHTAKVLGIGIRTLQRKLKKYNVK